MRITEKLLPALITAVLTITALSAAQDIRVETDPETGAPVIYEFRREVPTAMQDPEVEPAFPTPAPEPAPEPEPAPKQFVPINEITVAEVPAEPPPAAPAAAVRKKRHSIGGRLGFGNIMSAGALVKIGLTPTERMDVGANLGFLGVGKDGYRTSYVEAAGFYEWTFGISDDNVLGWYIGPGLAFGWYTASKPNVRDSLPDGSLGPSHRKTYDDFSVGVGGQFGLEVDFSFIDPDHSLYNTFKDAAVTLDARPMLYLPLVDNFQAFVLTVGISFRYGF